MPHKFCAPTDRVPDKLVGSGIREVRRVSRGHIHDTWWAVDENGDCFAIQALNHRVFADPWALADNLAKVNRRLITAGVPTAEAVGVGPSGAGLQQVAGRFWRAARWVDGRHPDPVCPDDVRAVAEAFGRFDSALAGVIGLNVAIPDFHDPPLRLARLRESADADPHGRSGSAMEAMGRVEELMITISPALAAKRDLPARIAHNDAKVDNAIIDRDGVITVIDLDTVMPGSILDDIGELVRSVVRPVEDKAIPGEIPVEMIEVIVSGFVRGFGEMTSTEAELVPWAGLVLTVENAIRFLTDFIEGDDYFAVDDPHHNMRRALAQIDLADRLVVAHDTIVAAVAGVIRG